MFPPYVRKFEERPCPGSYRTRCKMMTDARGELAQRALRGLVAVVIGLATIGPSSAVATDRIRIATMKTGTLAWELETLRAHDLDRLANLAIETTELASTEGGKIALKGGSVDLIVSDWLWVGRERALGDDLVFYPYSSALGAVMVPANSPIKGIADLKGKKLGVAGGPLDKSWLLLQALARRSGIDLKTEAAIAYGAPPLLTQKALQGETDATLTFWNFCADLEAKGHAACDPNARRREGSWRYGCGRHGRLRVRRSVGRNATGRCSSAFLLPRARPKGFWLIRLRNGSGSPRASG